MNGAPTRPVRITFLIGSLEVGGAERQLVTLVNRLDRSRFYPRVVCLFAGGELTSELSPDVPIQTLSLHRLRETGPRLRFVLGARLLLRLVNEIRSHRPDILHAYLPSAYVLGALVGAILRIPAVIAGRRGLTSYHVYRRLQWRVSSRIANQIIRLHLCNSEAVRRYALEKEGLDIRRTEVVHNGVDLDVSGVTPSVRADRGSDVTAAMIANFIPYKGHETLLHALPLVLERHPGFHVVLFGDGPTRPAMQSLAEELGVQGAVTFAGRRTDARDLLGEFDLILLCSTEEGFPNALMEGMARALPVVATCVGGVPELVRDGVDGHLFTPGNSDALATILIDLLDDPERRRQLGAQGRARVESEFSVRSMVARTEAIYLRLLHQSPVPLAEAV